MPLENAMSTPRHFMGMFGVLNQGMSGVTVVYILIGFLGYVKYGDATADSITVNLPRDEWWVILVTRYKHWIEKFLQYYGLLHYLHSFNITQVGLPEVLK